MSMAVPQVRQYLLVAAVLMASVVTPGECQRVVAISDQEKEAGVDITKPIHDIPDDVLAVCWCTGDPHCSSFDGLYPIDYQGRCEFLLAGAFKSESEGVTAFQVYAVNDDYFSPGYTAVSYVAQVRLVFGANEIKLTRDFTQWPPVTLRVNGIVRTISYTGAGYTVYYAGLSVRIETSFGVVVEYDGYYTASVSVPSSYRERLTGLCGNYDGDIDNDWTTADGTYVGKEETRANLLGDSYIVRSRIKERRCSEPAPPTPDPENCERYYEIEKLCTESIKASEKCVEVVGGEVAEAFIAACIMDGCLDNSGLSACAVLSKFFELCSQQGVEVSCSDWQKAGCDVLLADPKRGRCPAGLVYKCDVRACTPTCDNPKPRDGCKWPYREGCGCPDGQLLAADGKCYKECPRGCLIDGVIQPIDSKWTDPTTCASFSCVPCKESPNCPYGGNVVSTECDGVCVTGKCITQIACCNVNGDPHYVTYDHLYFSYQGVCKYTLSSVISGSKLPPGFREFKVYSRSEWRPHWQPGVSLTKYVEIVIGRFTVRISRNLASVLAIPASLTINGVPASIPFSDPSFNVYYTGSTVRLDTTFGVYVQYNGDRDVYVCVPEVEYAGLLEGLCGNNDDDAANDWTLADGITNVVGQPNAETILGDSFIIANDPEIDPNFPCPQTPNVTNQCLPVPPAHHAGCNILKDTKGPFSNCIEAIGASAAQIFYNNCLYDACFSDGASICDSIMTFVSMCQQIGSPVSCQDFLKTPCAVQCPAGMTFQCNISSCPATCAEPDAPHKCTRPMIDSCACPCGQFLEDGRCTEKCPIGCVDSALQFHPVGTSWPGTGCTVYTCVSQGSITQSTWLSNELCMEKTCVPDCCVGKFNESRCNSCPRVDTIDQGNGRNCKQYERNFPAEVGHMKKCLPENGEKGVFLKNEAFEKLLTEYNAPGTFLSEVFAQN